MIQHMSDIFVVFQTFLYGATYEYECELMVTLFLTSITCYSVIATLK